MRSLLLLALVCGPAFGKCITNDAWTGPDKSKHFAGGMVIGSAATLMTKSPEQGLMATAVIAALKEAADSRSPRHTCSLQDFAVTVVGGAAGAYGTAWLILPQKNGVQVAFAKRF